MFPEYAVNQPYLQEEFIHCRWDALSGMEPADLEKQINAMWDSRGNEPVAVAKARILRYIVENAQLEVSRYSRFPGKLNHGLTYDDKSHFALNGMYERLFARIREETLNREMPSLNREIHRAALIGIGSCETDFWHNLPNWSDLLSLGLPGLKSRAIRARKALESENALDAEQIAFFESVAIALSALECYIDRLIAYAKTMGGMEEFLDCMRRVRHQPPKTLYQAMTLTVAYLFIEELGCERGRTLGRLDQLYLPFYRRDLAAGEAQEEIKELFRYFFGRFSQAHRFAAQPLCLCGTDENGNDASSELTDLILDVYDDMNILDPKIHVRYFEGFSAARLKRIAGMIRSGRSAMVLVNDETVIRAYEKIGVPRELARQYLPLGCYEPTIMGVEDAMIGASWLSVAKAVELAMTGGVDAATGERITGDTGQSFQTFEDFYGAYLKQLDTLVEFIIGGIERQNAVSLQINPSPMYSATMESCVARGRDVFSPVSGMQIANISVKCCGIGTAADALAAVKVLVYQRGSATYAELRRAVLADWRGYEALREEALALKEKFGNHDPLTDQLARDIYKHLALKIVGRPTPRGGVYRMGGDSITRCISYGKGLCATPDGRKAGQPISKNFSGTVGMEKNGLTAAMLSALAIDQTDFCDACVLDFVAHPSALEGDKGLDAMDTMIRVYFENGGLAIQGNILNPEQLRDAQAHPENYPNLQVRVCGWNEYFVNMSADTQSAFIRRLEAMN